MKKTHLLIILITLSITSILAQNLQKKDYGKLPNLIPIKVDDLFGYCDSNLVIKIPPKYEDAYPFNEYNVACVGMDEKYGLIDTSGVEIIPLQYKNIQKFYGTHKDWRVLVEFVKAEKNDFILLDMRNNQVFQTKDSSFAFYAESDSSGIITNEKYLVKNVYRHNFRSNGNYTLIENGNLITFKNYYDNLSFNPDFNTFYGTYGKSLYSIDSNHVEKHIYKFEGNIGSTAYLISDSLLSIKIGEGWRMVNIYGDKLTPIFDGNLKLFGDDTLMAVRYDEKWGYINKKGELKIKSRFETAFTFYDSLAPVHIVDDSLNGWGLINYKGEFVIKPIFEFNEPKKSLSWNLTQYLTQIYNNNGNIFVYINDRFHIINSKGKLIPSRNSQHDMISSFHGGSKIDRLGRNMVTPNYALIRNNKGWGVIDSMGNKIIDTKFEQLGVIRNNIFPYKSDKAWGFMNTKGKILISAKFDNVYYLKRQALPNSHFFPFPDDSDLTTNHGAFLDNMIEFNHNEINFFSNSYRYHITDPMPILFYTNLARVQYEGKIVYCDIYGKTYYKE